MTNQSHTEPYWTKTVIWNRAMWRLPKQNFSSVSYFLHNQPLKGMYIGFYLKYNQFHNVRFQWQHQVGMRGHLTPQSEALPPLSPLRSKNDKNQPFRQIFGFLPPQKRILPPQCPSSQNLMPPLSVLASIIYIRNTNEQSFTCVWKSIPQKTRDNIQRKIIRWYWRMPAYPFYILSLRNDQS